MITLTLIGTGETEDHYFIKNAIRILSCNSASLQFTSEVRKELPYFLLCSCWLHFGAGAQFPENIGSDAANILFNITGLRKALLCATTGELACKQLHVLHTSSGGLRVWHRE